MFLPVPGSIAVRYQNDAGRFSEQQTYATGAGTSDVMFSRHAENT